MLNTTEDPSPRFWLRISSLLPSLFLILISFLTYFFVWKADHPAATSGTVSNSSSQNGAGQGTQPSKSANTTHSELPDGGFRQWLADFVQVPATAPEQKRWVAEGLALAKERRPKMENLIRSNSARAVAEGLHFDEWAVLPAEIQAEVEKPFSVTGAYTYYPICREPGSPVQLGESNFFASLTLPDGSILQAFPHGRRDGVFSKRTVPMQGIALGGLAAMRDGPLQIIDAAELPVVRSWFPNGQVDMDRSVASGVEVGETPTYVVAGGRIYAFANREEAEKIDSELAELDSKPGPFAASSLLADSNYTASNGSLNLPQVQSMAAARSTAWTETKKKVFLIRVNFSDQPEEPVSLPAVKSVMNQSSEMIRRMSYGKTWIDSAASMHVYTLPKTMKYYSAAPSRLWGELETDAWNTFREQKHGSDAAIDMGPVDASRGTTGDYDIIGVYRVTAPGEGAGGVAGGSGFVIMGSWANTIRVFTHEWGHNYGLGHSSLWKTTDGSAAGAGETEEYGDPFDLMGDAPMPEGHFHTEGKVRLNWLPPARWVDASVADSKTYRVFRIDDTATPEKLHGVRISRGGNGPQNGYYWIGHRGAFTSNPRLSKGAYLIWQRPEMNRSWLLDTTPNSIGGAKDSALKLGATFSDPLSHAYITSIAAGGKGAESYIDVRVNKGPFPQNAAPVASRISGPITVDARTPVTYSVTGSDANGDTLAYSWGTDDSLLSALPNARALKTSWPTGGNRLLSVVVSDMKGGTVRRNTNVHVNDPLDHWTKGNVGRPVSMVESLSGNGVMMGWGYWGELFRSSDGIKWTEVNHGTGITNWTRLAFGNGKYVMTGHRAGETKTRIAYSTDGRKWKMAKLPKQVPITKTVAYGAGRFVVAGEKGTILSSRDGMAWKKTTVTDRPDFHQLAWNGKVWLAIARNPVNNWMELVWTSPDADVWTPRKKIGLDGQRIYSHQGAFYFLSWWAGIWRSTNNGISWQSAVMPTGTRWSATRASIADDGTMVAIGIAQDEPLAPRILLVSVDGIHWHRTTSKGAKSAVSGTANNLGFIAGRMLIFCNEGVVRYSSRFKSKSAAKPQKSETQEDFAAGSSNLAPAGTRLTTAPKIPSPWADLYHETLQDTWKTLKTKDSLTGLRHLELVVIKVPGVDYRWQDVEVSSNLMDWKSGVNHTTIIRNDPWMLKVRDKMPISPEMSRYIRLRNKTSRLNPWPQTDD